MVNEYSAESTPLIYTNFERTEDACMRKPIALLLALIMAVCLAGCGVEQPGESLPARSEFRVGAIYITSRNDTAGYTYAHHNGIVTAMESLGLDPAEQLFIVDEIPEQRELVMAAVE